MCASSRIARASLSLLVVGGIAVAGCAPSSLDAERAAFVDPAGGAGRDASRARLALAEDLARHGLSLSADATLRPTPSRGAPHQAYLRWLRGEVRKLSGGESGGGAE